MTPLPPFVRLRLVGAIALLFALLPSTIRAQATENMVEMAMHLWRNDMQIHDFDGDVTKYGHLGGWVMDGGLPSPNGVIAIMSLAWFQSAATAAAGTTAGGELAAIVAQMRRPVPRFSSSSAVSCSESSPVL